MEKTFACVLRMFLASINLEKTFACVLRCSLPPSTLATLATLANALRVSFPPHLQFDYGNGFGERLGRFRLDLYQAQSGPGDCGQWVANICDKPEIGCRDSREFFVVFATAVSFLLFQSCFRVLVLLLLVLFPPSPSSRHSHSIPSFAPPVINPQTSRGRLRRHHPP